MSIVCNNCCFTTVVSDWLPHWMQRLLWYAKRQLQQNAPYVSLGIVRNTCVVLIIFYLVISRWRRGKCCRLQLDRYQYRVLANTCEYRWLSVSADTYFSIGTDTSSSFTCLNSQHCCMHSYSFKPVVCLIVRNTLLQCCRQQQVRRSS